MKDSMVLISSICGVILFCWLDGKLLAIFQKISDNITKRTGRNNFQVATLIAFSSNAFLFLYSCTVLLLKWKVVSNIVSTLLFLCITGLLIINLYCIHLGKKIYRIDDELVKKDWKAENSFEMLRMIFFLYGTSRLGLIIIIDQWMDVYMYATLLIVCYFSSCMPLPGTRDKVKVKVKFKLWNMVKSILNPTLPPVPVPIDIKK